MNGDNEYDLDKIWLNYIQKHMKCNGYSITFAIGDKFNPAEYSEDQIDDDDDDDLSILQSVGIILIFLLGALLWYFQRQKVLMHQVHGVAEHVSVSTPMDDDCAIIIV